MGVSISQYLLRPSISQNACSHLQLAYQLLPTPKPTTLQGHVVCNLPGTLKLQGDTLLIYNYKYSFITCKLLSSRSTLSCHQGDKSPSSAS